MYKILHIPTGNYIGFVLKAAHVNEPLNYEDVVNYPTLSVSFTNNIYGVYLSEIHTRSINRPFITIEIADKKVITDILTCDRFKQDLQQDLQYIPLDIEFEIVE